MIRFSPVANRLVSFAIVSALLLVAWHLAGGTDSGRFLVSQPLTTFTYAIERPVLVARSLGWTLAESAGGLSAATAFALLIGGVAVVRPAVTRLAHPLLVASQVVPFVCLAPLVILVFGPGPWGKTFLSAVMCFFPIVTGILAAIRHAPKPHLELMRLLGAPRSVVIRHIIAPHAAPHFFAGLRVAAPFAVIGAIVAEFNGAEWGIGKDLFIAAKRLEPEMMMIGLLSGALASGLLYAAVLFAESRLGPWYRISKSNEN